MYWMQLRRGQLDAFDRRTPVILPTAAVEQHGEHLPLGTDCMITGAVIDRLDQAMDRKILVMPTVQVGCSEHHMVFPGSLTLTHETYRRTVMEYVDSVRRHGFRRVMILNGHGGNEAINAVLNQQIGQQYEDLECLVGGWAPIGAPQTRAISEGGHLSCGHAGEFETSIMLALAEELCDMSLAEDGGIPTRVESMRYDLFGGGVASSYQPFHELSHNGVYGKPSLASAEKGHRILSVTVESIQELIESFWDDVKDLPSLA
ncbi:MAG: creatininase family protein [Lentisphaeria bacterium]|jgi:creatinine amidohydrolase|nr:creatininase family protein [Lentisphaeria bacterium]